jgi:hypothetical protein
MKTDFKNAYLRHHVDAEFLFDQKRYANADHLYWLAAECAIKAVMIGIDPNLVAQNGELKKQSDKKHIDMLWPHFRFFLQGRNASTYSSVFPAPNNPFNKWSISDRYIHPKHFTKSKVQVHKAAVNGAIANLIAHARAQGVL